MLYAVYCVDKPNAAALRAELRPPHQDYLKTQEGIIVVAGATQTDDGETATGSMFIVNVDSRAEAEAFAKGDPFNSGGLFENVVVTRMRKGHWHPENGDSA
ncbi:MAG: YciI family protein [Alphaproteobacteria bacterium]|nr:YciI family protein [Alphaproteobacteria bacterium]